MRILFVSSEVYPLAKTGGLADVSEALPKALRALDMDIRLLMPGYSEAKAVLGEAGGAIDLGNLLGQGPVQLLPGSLPGSDVPIWLVDCPPLFERPGRLYGDVHGYEWPDNGLRFALLNAAAARVATGDAAAWAADVVHANDWHAGLLPAYLQAYGGARRPACVFTIHNLAYQGNFPPALLPVTGLPDRMFTPDGIEYHGQLSFMKAGLRYADLLTTVSPTYAEEILTPEFGFGLEGVLCQRRDRLNGILNGADYAVWSPATDPHIAAQYSVADIAGKRTCARALRRELGLDDIEAPIIAFMSRLTHQKMADVVVDTVPSIVESGNQLAVVAEGAEPLEAAFETLGQRFPGRVTVRIGYREDLAHRLLAGADMLLAPARFEPCGLTQIYAMRYATVPIVRRTGGLADTVVDAASPAGNGIVFDGVSASALRAAVERAVELHTKPIVWRRLQRNGLRADFSWTRSAARYAALYASLRPQVALTHAVATQPPEAEDVQYLVAR